MFKSFISSPFLFLFYLCSSLSLSLTHTLSVARIWPSLWYPGKPACFHDNVCRLNSVFVLSWIRSESVSSVLDTHTHVCAHWRAPKHTYMHHEAYAQRGHKKMCICTYRQPNWFENIKLNIPTQTKQRCSHLRACRSTHNLTHLMKPFTAGC